VPRLGYFLLVYQSRKIRDTIVGFHDRRRYTTRVATQFRDSHLIYSRKISYLILQSIR
jgi:hypothetical protein